MQKTVRSAILATLDSVGLRRTARRARRYLAARGYATWTPLIPETEFYQCVREAIRQLRRDNPDESFGAYLEFGVSRGTSMACVYRALQDEGLASVRLVGFDSFEGLPPEAADEGWTPGDFHSSLAATTRYLTGKGVDLSRVALVKGWFKDTLTPETCREHSLTKASLIMVDCDIYSASREALTFCAPLIQDRAVLLFDDWGCRSDAGEIGQKEAFEEFLTQHPDLQAEPLPGYFPQSRVFLVRRREKGVCPGPKGG